MTRRPSFQFYPGDWHNDPALRACSDLARLLWLDLLCLMHQGEPYGFLTLPNGAPIDQKMIQKLIVFDQKNAKKISKLFQELIKNGVIKQADNGLFYSKRMVSDELERRQWQEKKQKQRQATGKKCPQVVPVLSNSSSSSSSSSYIPEPIGSGQPAAPVATSPTPQNSIWGDGLELLMRAGCSETSARSFLGRALRDYGESALSEAITATLLEDAVNPKAFLLACLKNGAAPKPRQARYQNGHQRLHGSDIVPAEQRQGGIIAL